MQDAVSEVHVPVAFHGIAQGDEKLRVCVQLQQRATDVSDDEARVYAVQEVTASVKHVLGRGGDRTYLRSNAGFPRPVKRWANGGDVFHSAVSVKQIGIPVVVWDADSVLAATLAEDVSLWFPLGRKLLILNDVRPGFGALQARSAADTGTSDDCPTGSHRSWLQLQLGPRLGRKGGD
jgi:hypothetical protein